MVTFELTKPAYEWRTIGPETGSDLFLSRDIETWLLTYNISYDVRVEHEERDYGDGLHTYLIFYIDIDDEKAATLFKLTWM